MAYTSLGFSLPDLTVSGESAPTTQWGGTLTLDVTLRNLGASTIVEPTSLVPATQLTAGPDGTISPPYYTPSQADAPATKFDVILVPPGRRPGNGVVIGSLDVPAISQNNMERYQATVTLPDRPAGFPNRGPFQIRLVANVGNQLLESRYRNNASPPLLVRLTPAPATPALRAVSFDAPDAGLVPGDVIKPRIQIANIGGATLTQPVEVAVVASTSPDFNLGSSIVSLYTIEGGIGGVNSTPLPNITRHRGNRLRPASLQNIVTPQNNVVTIDGDYATLPVSPSTYYIGIVIDPFNKLNLPNQPANRLELVKVVSTANGGVPGGIVGGSGVGDFENTPDGLPIGVTY